MAMGGGGGRGKLQSDINVTPLVDVCLVLLIIFMVVTPLLQNGVSVQIPQADNPDKKPEGPKQKLIVVQYATPPAYHMDSKQFSKAELQAALDELYQRNPTTDLVIKADQRLKYGDVKEVFKMTKDAGFQDVGLIAEKKQKGEARLRRSPPRSIRRRSPAWEWEPAARGEYKSDINITPLVDVVLVLLIIFMVITPLLQMGYDVKVPPKTNTPHDHASPDRPDDRVAHAAEQDLPQQGRGQRADPRAAPDRDPEEPRPTRRSSSRATTGPPTARSSR